MSSRRPPPIRRGETGGLLGPAAKRLAALAPLSPEEIELILGLDGQVETHAPGDEVVAPDARAVHAALIVEGWACRQRVLPDGRRQIFGFLMPGDSLGLCRDAGPLALSSTIAVTRLTTMQAAELRTAAMEAPDGRAGLALALRGAERQDEARLLDHITRLGRQSAYERVAHLLLELHGRMTTAGLARGPSFSMPLTQEVLADALGLSIVHVNRVLQQLRRERLLEMRAGKATLLQPQLLAEIADFPAYRG